jgi:cellulose synthase/poly-beta-1,6-N-acetylglucosamine synthase-like glycosyltransferase
LLLISFIWLIFIAIFIGVYASYFAYVRFSSFKPWNIKIDENFSPHVSILIPVHNEGKNIRTKLENILNVSYPKEKIEVIICDDASTDNTLDEIYRFKTERPELNIKIIRQNHRVGKAKILNTALPSCSNDIIIVSDADCIWHIDTLSKAMPYMADPSVGAITGVGFIENQDSWVTQNEIEYLGISNMLRLGESKIYSTIRFEGGVCAYKRCAFKKFDDESGCDDSGTALSIIQNGLRTLCIPEVRFTTKFPSSLSGKVKVKVRRASQLITLWLKCARLLLKKRIYFPKRIALPNIVIFIINPLLFSFLVPLSIILIVTYPLALVLIAPTLSILFIVPKFRRLFAELIVDNIILFYSLILVASGKKFIAWEKDN